MNIQEIKNTLNYLVDNNLKLVEEGKDKLTVSVVGHGGIGKTSIIKQLAEERGAGYYRLNLASLEEIGDLCGIPVKEYLMHSPEQEELWVAEKVVDRYAAMGYTLCPTCLPRMSYATPSWVPKDPEQEFILTLDDYNRSSPLFMQAIMSLTQFGEYVSWKLPKNCHLILTANPDDGSYNVTSMDEAQMSRIINFDMEFDVQCFAKWMEVQNMRSELKHIIYAYM